MSARFRSTVAGDTFLQPLDFHVEPADPFVEFGPEGLVVVALAAAPTAEEGLGAVEELLSPLTDLSRQGGPGTPSPERRPSWSVWRPPKGPWP
jgi:hypothetical protein